MSVVILQSSRGLVVKVKDLRPVSLGSAPLVLIWVIDGGRKDIRPKLPPPQAPVEVLPW